MIASMTGYGKEVLQLPSKKITIELKSLNSKQLDLTVRVPQMYKSKEMAVRQIVAKTVVRGKVELSFYAELTGAESAASINEELAVGYIEQLKRLADATQISGDYLSAVMRMPEVLRIDKQEISNEEWTAIVECLEGALNAFNEFRLEEGKSLEADFVENISQIESLLQQVAPFEEERVIKLRERITNQLEGIEEGFDSNRLEQEMIFYLERLDINEEKVRLNNHLKYFIKTMNEEQFNGKKLGFICQEIGREINTLGSKANHAQIQKLVVQMKDALERIKEQVLNTL